MKLSSDDKYELDLKLRQEIEDVRFAHHSPAPELAETFALIREDARKFAQHIVNVVPIGRERSLALTKLEEVVMWANAGIAREDAKS